MASDINELLEKLKIDSAYIWGQSDGGIIALILALNHPDKVKKAVVFAANVIPDSTGIEALILRHFKRLASGSNDQKERQLNTLMVKHPNIALSKLNTISAQIMIMSGDRDQIPISHTLDIYKNIPNSNLCIIPGATHGAAWQKTKLFHEILTDFFEKPFGKPSSIDRYR
jgi:pimeloyl-ACP methyl ester carboxylesterase